MLGNYRRYRKDFVSPLLFSFDSARKYLLAMIENLMMDKPRYPKKYRHSKHKEPEHLTTKECRDLQRIIQPVQYRINRYEVVQKPIEKPKFFFDPVVEDPEEFRKKLIIDFLTAFQDFFLCIDSSIDWSKKILYGPWKELLPDFSVNLVFIDPNELYNIQSNSLLWIFKEQEQDHYRSFVQVQNTRRQKVESIIGKKLPNEVSTNYHNAVAHFNPTDLDNVISFPVKLELSVYATIK